MTTTVNEPAERLREWMLNGDGRMWVPDLDAALAAERAIGAEVLPDRFLLDQALQETRWWERGRHGSNGLSSGQLAEETIAAYARLTRERNGR